MERFLDILTEGIIITDENFKVSYTNAAALKLLDLPAAKLLGKHILSMHSFKHQKEIKYIQEHFLAGTLAYWEKNMTINDNFIQMHIKPIYKNKKFQGIMTELVDVTEIRQSKQSQENLLKMYTMIFNATNTAMLSVDKNGIVTSYNPAAEKLLGIPSTQIVNKDYAAIMFDGKTIDDKGNYLSQVIESLETGKEYKNLKKELEVSNTKLTILLDTCVLRDASQKMRGVVAVFRDITDYTIKENFAHRQEKYAVLSQLAAGIADEMRNPLMSVKGFMELLHHRMRKTRQKEYVELALDELKRMEQHIRNFLLFSKPDAPVVQLGNLNRIIKEVISQYRNNANYLDFEFITPNEEFFMCIDEDQIRQVFINLLQNAVEAAPAVGGKITIRQIFSKSEPFVSVSIEDNGSGISNNVLTQIYEPFFTTKDLNSGLGLTIAKRIIEGHGGEIKAYNNSLGGATLKVNLPFGAYLNKKPLCAN